MKLNLIILLTLFIIIFSKDPNEKKTTENKITATSNDEHESVETKMLSDQKDEYKEEIIKQEEIEKEEKLNNKNSTESVNINQKEENKDEDKESEVIKKRDEKKGVWDNDEEDVKDKDKKNKEKDLIEDEEEKQDRDKKSNNGLKEVEKTNGNKKNINKISPDKILVLTAPYQDNEDFIITPLGFGTPVNFVPLQIDTTSYKTWVASSSNKDNKSAFNYDKNYSKTSKESNEWDSIVDGEGTINGNVIYDTINLGNFKIERFKFIEAIEYEDGFNDFKNGKIGLGNCQYADGDNLKYCLIQRLKDNGSIERRLFTLREYSDTHGEIVIGDVTPFSKENDYPLLSVVDKNIYDNIDDDEFKMSWLTKVSHVLFNKDGEPKISKIFNNNIYIEDGLASFDSSCHYIEAPYTYVNQFQEKMFEKYYPNACRKVNNDGTYMFLCNKERFELIKDDNKDLSLIIIMDGNGFSIPMNSLFEQTMQNNYEFFVHFKDFEQNTWNLGHPFFHHYTIIFDQDNQEIGIDGGKIYNLKDQTESAIKNVIVKSRWWKIVLFVLFLLLILLCGLCCLLRHLGIKYKLDQGISPSLVDNESIDDLSFAPGQNVR